MKIAIRVCFKIHFYFIIGQVHLLSLYSAATLICPAMDTDHDISPPLYNHGTVQTLKGL